jgi:hypothetical protein
MVLMEGMKTSSGSLWENEYDKINNARRERQLFFMLLFNNTKLIILLPEL